VPSHISVHYVLWGTIPLVITCPREQFRLLYGTSKRESADDAGASSGPAVARVGGVGRACSALRRCATGLSVPQRSWRLNKSTSGLFPSIVTEFLSGFWLCLRVRLAAPNTLALDARRFSHPCLAATGRPPLLVFWRAGYPLVSNSLWLLHARFWAVTQKIAVIGYLSMVIDSLKLIRHD
jgi:hypothetical protein